MKLKLKKHPHVGFAQQFTTKTAFGFVLSLILTIAAYFIVIGEIFEDKFTRIFTLLILAAFQTLIQLICFLDLGDEPHPKWQLMSFYFMLTVLVIIVAGSLLIMYSLNYRLM